MGRFKKPILLFSLLIVIATISHQAQTQQFKSFDEVQTKINELESAKNYEGAIEFINGIRNQFPGNEFEVLLDLAYCNLRLKNYDICMDIWEEGHGKGFFFLFRSASPNYEDIKDNERFKRICDEDNKLRQAANEKSKTIYEVKLPANYSPENVYPVMIIFHGGGRNINSPKPVWTSNTLNEKFIIVYMQSYLHYGSKTFGWGNHDLRAEEGIKNNFYEVVEKYSVDTTNVYIGGISAGGSIAFDLGIINPLIPLKGIIAICPAIAGKDFTIEQINAFKKSGIELNIITGKDDWGLERQKEVMKMLDDAGVGYNVTIIPGMGHEYPEDLGERLESIFSDF